MTTTPRKVLLAVDGSMPSIAAARIALQMASGWKAAVRAVAVGGEERTSHLINHGGGPGPSAQERRATQLQDALEYVRRLARESEVELEAVFRESSGASPYEIILREANEWSADVIFLGRSGRRGLGRALLGSQTEHVLEFAPIPVVVVPVATRADAGLQS